MSGCEPVEMPVCEHLIPVKLHCAICNEKVMETKFNVRQLILERMNKLDEHKCRQIDENRKISRRADELEYKIKKMEAELDWLKSIVHTHSYLLCKDKG